MASSLLDIQQTAAVPRPQDVASIHSTSYISKKDVLCRRGIVKTHILREMGDLLTNYDRTYLETLPDEIHRIKPDKVQQQLQELR